MKWLVGATCVAIIGFSNVAYVYASEDAPVRACESALKIRLKSPSSYKRISVAETSRDMTSAEYSKGMPGDSDNVKKALSLIYARSQLKPKIVNVTIEYDADNSYGVAIRAHSTCTYETDNKIATIN